MDRFEELFSELNATLRGAHALMENVSANERRIGPLGSHARGYTHKLTKALNHLKELQAAFFETQGFVEPSSCRAALSLLLRAARAENLVEITWREGVGLRGRKPNGVASPWELSYVQGAHGGTTDAQLEAMLAKYERITEEAGSAVALVDLEDLQALRAHLGGPR